MDKPEIILQLEKELNTTFKQVDVEEIIKHKYGKTTEYSLGENQQPDLLKRKKHFSKKN